MRAIGLDLGTRRIGVALAVGEVAVPLTVIRRSGDRATDHAAVAAVVAEEEAERVVVGLPLSLSGRRGPAADAAAGEADALARALTVPVELWDERLSTVAAERSLKAGGLRGRERRRVVDQVAAAVVLQSWLDARR